MWSIAGGLFTLLVVLKTSSLAKLVEENETVVQVWCSENLRNLIADKLEELDRKIELLDLKLSTKATTTTVESKTPDIQQLIANSVKDYQNQLALEAISQHIKEMQANQRSILAQMSKLNETFNKQLGQQQTTAPKVLQNKKKESVSKAANDDEEVSSPNISLPLQRFEQLIAAKNLIIIQEIDKFKKDIKVELSTLYSRLVHNNDESRIMFHQDEANMLNQIQTEIIERSQKNFDYQTTLHQRTLHDIGEGFKACSIPKREVNNTIKDFAEELQEPTFESCAHALQGNATSGVYHLSLPQSGLAHFPAYCLADPLNGTAWTIIQRRQDGSVEFYRSWHDYKEGFGNLQSEYWLGLEKIYAMTSNQPHELWIKLIGHNGQTRNVQYNLFEIGDENEGYYLKTVGKYTGTAGNALGPANKSRKFTTFDVDNDQDISRNCAATFTGAWWYDNCNWSDLNGQYKSDRPSQGIHWSTWLGYDTTIKYVHMAIRAVD